jgi:hypothetical protein
MNKEKRPYEAPALTVVSFKMEKGYAYSGETIRINLGLIQQAIGLSSQTIETRTDGGVWGGSEDWSGI